MLALQTAQEMTVDGTTDILTHVESMTQSFSVQMTCVVLVEVVTKLRLSKYAQIPTMVLVTLVVINVTGMSVTQDTADTTTLKTLLLLLCVALVGVDPQAHVKRLTMVLVISPEINAIGTLQIHPDVECTIPMNSSPMKCAALAGVVQSQVNTDFPFLPSLLTLNIPKSATLPILRLVEPSLLPFSAPIMHSRVSKRNQSVTRSPEISTHFQNSKEFR